MGPNYCSPQTVVAVPEGAVQPPTVPCCKVSEAVEHLLLALEPKGLPAILPGVGAAGCSLQAGPAESGMGPWPLLGGVGGDNPFLWGARLAE